MFSQLVVHNEWIRNIAGIVLTLLGFLDGYKYRLESLKIRECRTSEGHSRKFINIALSNDLFKLFYFVFIDQNIYVLVSTIFALICMVDMFWAIYLYYSYCTYPKRVTIKRPNLYIYIINSLIFNKYRTKL
jgi:hypothetical protein